MAKLDEKRDGLIDAWVLPKNRAGIRKKKPQVPVYNYQIINNNNKNWLKVENYCQSQQLLPPHIFNLESLELVLLW